MSAFANFFLLNRDEFSQLEKIAKSFPLYLTKIESVDLEPTLDEDSVAKFHSAAEKMWKFLRENGETPYIYSGSGYVMAQVLMRFEREKIQIVSSQLNVSGNNFVWQVIDKHASDNFKHLVNPLNFSNSEVESWIEEFEAFATVKEVKDAIKVIYNYLELITESNVVLLNIG